MAKTLISDVIVPEIFNPYLKQKTTVKNALLSSGIATSDPSVAITRGGKTVNIPFWKQLSGGIEVLSDTTALTLNKIDADSDIAAVHARGVAYGVNGLAEIFSGDDPAGAIAEFLATAWDTEMNAVIVNTLTGIMGVAGMAASINDQSANVLTAGMMIDTMFKLGDNFDKIKAVAMHSLVVATLKQLDLVEFIPPSEISAGYLTYMDKRVIVDDALVPSAEGVYPIYFFGEGAFAYNENTNLMTTKTDEDILADDTVIASRRYFTMHPRGVKWIGTPAGTTPSNAELATAANWQLVDDRKNVAITMLKAKLA